MTLRQRSISAIKTIKFEDVAGKGAKQLTFNEVPVDRAAEYSAEDADVTLQLHQVLSAKLRSVPALERLYEEIEQPLVPVLARMEYRGGAHRWRVARDPEPADRWRAEGASRSGAPGSRRGIQY